MKKTKIKKFKYIKPQFTVKCLVSQFYKSGFNDRLAENGKFGSFGDVLLASDWTDTY